jgi:hypothetical protein
MCLAAASPPPPGDASPSGVRLEIRVEPAAPVLGERVEVHYTLRNETTRAVSIGMGGDSRGAIRLQNFLIEAIHESGEKAWDPDPDRECTGGPATTVTVQPGKSWTNSVAIDLYAVIERPGRWTIRASYSGFPWRSKEGAPLPTGTTVVEFVEPDTERARAVLARLPRPPRSDRLRTFSAVHPAYTPLLETLAREGEAGAIGGLGLTRTPAASLALARLLDHEDGMIAGAAGLFLAPRDVAAAPRWSGTCGWT